MKQLGVVTGIIGAILLSLNIEISPYGWVFFLVSSVSWVVDSIKHNHREQLLVQLVFVAVNILGIYCWLL